MPFTEIHKRNNKDLLIELIYENNLRQKLEIGTAAKRRICKRAKIQKHFKPIQSILQLLIIKQSFYVS